MPAANDDDVGDKMSGVARKMVCAARVWSCAADFDDVAELQPQIGKGEIPGVA